MKIQTLCLLVSIIGLIACAGSGITYDYADQGDSWVTNQLGQCAGTKQSPIDLPSWSAYGCNSDVQFDLEFNNQVMTDVEVKFPGDQNDPNNIELVGAFTNFRINTLENLDHTFSAIQFHIHSPSEHTIEGNQKDVELHIVHVLDNVDADTNYNLAVFGIFFELDTSIDGTDAENDTIFGKIDVTSLNSTTGTIDSLTSSELFADVDLSAGVWAYQGSLTTPPCTEAVNWFVSSDVQKISTAQLEAIQNVLLDSDNDKINSFLGNYRNVQPLGDRTLHHVCQQQNSSFESESSDYSDFSDNSEISESSDYSEDYEDYDDNQ